MKWRRNTFIFVLECIESLFQIGTHYKSIFLKLLFLYHSQNSQSCSSANRIPTKGVEVTPASQCLRNLRSCHNSTKRNAVSNALPKAKLIKKKKKHKPTMKSIVKITIKQTVKCFYVQIFISCTPISTLLLVKIGFLLLRN